MRLLAIVLFAGACVGGAMRPAVIPKLSAMPDDPQKRDAVLDSSVAQPSGEQRPGMTKKQRTIESAAATAATALGILFSSSSNVTLGAASSFDENLVLERRAQPRHEAADEHDPEPADPAVDPVQLVPWVRLQ